MATQFKLDSEPNHIIYSANNFVVSKQLDHIVLSDCAGNQIAKHRAPLDARYYEFTDIGDHLVFLFMGKQIIAMPKSGGNCIGYTLDPITIGRCPTKIFNADGTIIFGTVSNNRSQIIRYDLIRGKRLVQTASKSIDVITDMVANGFDAYALYGGSLLIAYDMQTGAMKWSKFEAGMITNLLMDEGLYYASNNIISFMGKENIKYKTPFKIKSLEAVNDGHVYFIAEENRVCSFNFRTKEMIWDKKIDQTIKQSVVYNNKMIVLCDDGVLLIDLIDGKTLRSFYVDQVYQIKLTGDNLLIHKKNGTTDILGLDNDTN